MNCHVFIATSARVCKALDHCNPKHKLAVVVSSLVAHQIPAVVVVVCLFGCFNKLIEVADELKLPPSLDDVSVYNNN